jgi:hypothetical protein
MMKKLRTMVIMFSKCKGFFSCHCVQEEDMGEKVMWKHQLNFFSGAAY